MRPSIRSPAICCSSAAPRISPGGTCCRATVAHPDGAARNRPHSRQPDWRPIRISPPMVDGSISFRPDRRRACTAGISIYGACNARQTANGVHPNGYPSRSIPPGPSGFLVLAGMVGCTLAPAAPVATVKRISGARDRTARDNGVWRTWARPSTGLEMNMSPCPHPMENGCSSRPMTVTSNPRGKATAGRRGDASDRRSMPMAAKSARSFRPPAIAFCSLATSREMIRANFSFGDCTATNIGRRSVLAHEACWRLHRCMGSQSLVGGEAKPDHNIAICMATLGFACPHHQPNGAVATEAPATSADSSSGCIPCIPAP